MPLSSSLTDWLWCDVPNVCYQHSFADLVEEDKRGRVMSIYTMCFMGMMPIGSLIAGASATALGVPITIFVSGLSCLMLAAWFYGSLPTLRLQARPIMAARLAEQESLS